jgi:hypothetical protein
MAPLASTATARVEGCCVGDQQPAVSQEHHIPRHDEHATLASVVTCPVVAKSRLGKPPQAARTAGPPGTRPGCRRRVKTDPPRSRELARRLVASGRAGAARPGRAGRPWSGQCPDLALTGLAPAAGAGWPQPPQRPPQLVALDAAARAPAGSPARTTGSARPIGSNQPRPFGRVQAGRRVIRRATPVLGRSQLPRGQSGVAATAAPSVVRRRLGSARPVQAPTSESAAPAPSAAANPSVNVWAEA